ncbi:MAG: Hsp70 family protein, partial [bacterium]|nr:Hsp70 family protein [bacterium]
GNEPLHLKLTLTRSQLEKLIEPIIERCKGPIDTALEDARKNPRFSWKGRESITKVILVGGPTRMPIIQRFIEDYVGIKPERGIDPMECVAFGAAIQAGVLMGEIKDIVLLDVTPLTLGVEVLGGMTEPIIERNTTIPIKKSKIFTTAADNQTAVTIHIVQGERPMAKDNTSLGMFNLEGIPPAPRGVPQIEVTFDIDASGILHVTAMDLGTKKQASIRIEAPHKLKKEEVERMIKEAEKYAEEDRKKKELITAKNELDTLIYSVEKSLKEYGSRLSENDRNEILKAIEDAKEVLKKENVGIEEVNKTKEELAKKSHKLAEIIYKEAKKEEEKKDNGGVVEGEQA